LIVRIVYLINILTFKFIEIVSFNHQPSLDRDDICSPTHDTETSTESFSGVVPDVDDIYETKPIDPSTLVCRKSYCVPYTNEIDENDGKIKISFDKFLFVVFLFIRNIINETNINNYNYNTYN